MSDGDAGFTPLTQQALVQLVIRLHRVAPEEAGTHCTAAHGFQQMWPFEYGQGAFHRVAIALYVWRIEQKAGYAIVDTVSQATGAMGDGQRGEALGIHLAQSAGLIARRHQQKIAAGEQPAGIGFVEADMGAHATWVTFRQTLNLLFQRWLASAEDGQLAATGDDGFSDVDAQIDALLLRQARNHRKQRPFARLKAKQVANMRRVGALAVPVVRPEWADRMCATLRVPATIDAVEQSAPPTLAPLHRAEAIQPATKLRCGDLPRIGGADRGDMIGIGDAGLEQ